MDLRKRKDKPILQIKTRKARKPKCSLVSTNESSIQLSNVPLVVAELVAEPQTELVAESQTELVGESQTELVAEPQTELVAEPQTELVSESHMELEAESQTRVESGNIESDEIETKIKRPRASYKVINTLVQRQLVIYTLDKSINLI